MSLNGSNNINILIKNSVNNLSDFYIIRIMVDADSVETDGMKKC